MCSLNVRGIRDSHKRRKLFIWLRNLNFNIYFLQETHSTKNDEFLWKNEWGSTALFTYSSSNSTGCGFLINKLDGAIEKVCRDSNGRFLIIQINFKDEIYTMVNIYGPNKDDPNFFKSIFENIQQNFDNTNIILGGNFNFIQNFSLDKRGGINTTFTQSREIVWKFLDEYDLIDIWRIRHPLDKKYTWHRTNPEIFCRLDYFFIPTHKSAEVVKTDIRTAIVTDHSLITIEFFFKIHERGPGFWKLNCSLLYDKTYIDFINTVIRTTINAGLKDKIKNPDLWELIKFNIKTESISYSKEKQKNNKANQKYLEQKLNNLKESVTFYKDIEEKSRILDEISYTEDELSKILDNQTEAAKIRSRAAYYENGEKNTRYFLGLEKRNSAKKCVTNLICSDGTIADTKERILKEEEQFYSTLYTSKNSFTSCPEDYKDIFFDESQNFNKLNDKEKNNCEGPIRIDECEKVLKTMKNNKSPGIDGLPCEFYKIFWGEVKDILIKSFNDSFEIGKMSISQRQSIISLIPKKDKDTRYLKNWRPISLLNTDYKIAAKVIAHRISTVLPSIISSDQTGFVKNRYIGENIRTILDVLSYTEQHDIPGFIFSIDFEKAFDSIDWDYMYKALSFFGFGDTVIQWIKTFYTDISSRTINNGWASNTFSIMRGVRQGCPLSPYLYVICAEILAIAVKNSSDIKGIDILNTIFLIIQFADDTQFFLNGTRQSLNAALKLLEKYEVLSGLKINFDKSECYKIGSLRNDEEEINTCKNIKWSPGPINILGMKIPITDKNAIFKLNLEDKIKNVKQTIKIWECRKLTILGRVNILKSQLLSKFTYVFSVLPNIPSHFIEEIQNICFKFVWAGKPDKIKRNVQINNSKNGGLSVPDIDAYQKSLKITWIKRYINSMNLSKWKLFFTKTIEPFGRDIFFFCNMSPDDRKINQIHNDFHRDIIKNWFEISENTNISNSQDIENQIIWNNKYIRIQNDTIYLAEWANKGIIHIGDLFNNGKSFSLNEFLHKFQLHINFLMLCGLYSAIPNSWKHILKNSNVQTIRPFNITTKKYIDLMQKQNICKLFYWKYINSKCMTPERIIRKWQSMLDNVTDSEINNIFTISRSCTTEIKLQNFQFKFLHQILPNNMILFKMGKRETNTCIFCNTAVDNLEHMFWSCNKIQIFLKRTEFYLQKKLGEHFTINKKQLFLGYLGKDNFELINHLYLLLKFYIFTCFVTERRVSVNAFLNKIIYTEETERYIAKKNETMKNHFDKWIPIFAEIYS